MNLAPGTRLGPYEIVVPIGEGGMGEVYRAVDTRLDRTVAIKVVKGGTAVSAQLRQRFEREARLISRLTHPHICTLYDVGRENGFDFFVMEFVDGETLASRLEARSLSIKAGLQAMTEVADAIACAHRAGVIHRDLTPRNIMLTRSGAKLLDFGLATYGASRQTAFDNAAVMQSTAPDLTGDLAVPGTLPYMAPEQLQGRDADSRSDIFAFGAVLYEVVTGRRAFSGPTHARIIAQILQEEPPPIELPEGTATAAVERIVRTCLAKDPADRWQDASDLLRELRWTLDDERQRSTLSGLSIQRVARRWRRAVLAGLVAAAAIGGTYLLTRWWPQSAVVAASRLVVVLPCRAIGSDELEQRYCDGLAATLTAKLARLTASHRVQVVPASEVRTRRLDSPEAARREMSASLAFEGNFLREGKLLRVNYALVDAITLSQLDAFSFTAPDSDAFAIQDRVIEWALTTLELKLSGAERQALAAHGTQIAGVYEYYLQGRGYLLDYHRPGNTDSAIGLFERALALDPRHAPSQAGLGEAYWLKYEETRDAGWVERARDACGRAAGLDSGLAAAHECLGTVDVGTGAYERAVADFEQALRAEPTSDEAYLGLARAQDALGLTDAAEQTYRRAVDLRPAYWASRNWLAAFYRGHARYDLAIQQYEQGVQLSPDNALAFAFLSGIYGLVGRYPESLDAAEKSIALVPTTYGYVGQGMTLYRMRRFPEAVTALEKAKDLRTDFRSIGNLARACYWAGDRDRARMLYTQAVALTRDELAVNPRSPDLNLVLAEAQAKLGERTQALDVLAQMRLTDPHMQHFAAMTYAMLGEQAAALELLRKARDGALPVSELTAWIDLDSLRGLPKFAELVR